jgi:hypothetical protein
MLQEAFQVFIQELNESELSDEVSKANRQCQKPGRLSSPRDECRGYLREKLPALALGIKAAGLVYGLGYGTVEATRRWESKRRKRKTVRSKVEKRGVVADEVVVAMKFL